MKLDKPVMVKIAMIPAILEAATLLYECELIKAQPASVVRLFVQKNPDINERLKGLEP